MKCSRITKNKTNCKNPVASGSGTWTAEDGWVYYDCKAHLGSTAPVQVHKKTVGHGPDQMTIEQAEAKLLELGNKRSKYANVDGTYINLETKEEHEDVVGLPDNEYLDWAEIQKHTNQEVEELQKAKENSRIMKIIQEGKEGVYKPNQEVEMQKVKMMVSGHRDVQNFASLVESLVGLINRATESGKQVTGIAGGAKGADFAWAKAVKQTASRLELYIPHEQYYPTYKPVAPAVWTAMQEYASEVKYTIAATRQWHYSYNFARNEEMIKDADVHIIVSPMAPSVLFQESRGGTAHAVKTIARLYPGKKVFWVNPINGEINWVAIV